MFVTSLVFTKCMVWATYTYVLIILDDCIIYIYIYTHTHICIYIYIYIYIHCLSGFNSLGSKNKKGIFFERADHIF